MSSPEHYLRLGKVVPVVSSLICRLAMALSVETVGARRPAFRAREALTREPITQPSDFVVGWDVEWEVGSVLFDFVSETDRGRQVFGRLLVAVHISECVEEPPGLPLS